MHFPTVAQALIALSGLCDDGVFPNILDFQVSSRRSGLVTMLRTTSDRQAFMKVEDPSGPSTNLIRTTSSNPHFIISQPFCLDSFATVKIMRVCYCVHLRHIISSTPSVL
jgi:hypothetical protein